MDENQNPTSHITVTDVVVLAPAIFGVCVIAKLGYDLGKEGIRNLKAKKNQTEK